MFRGIDKLLFTKDFRKFKVLDRTKIRTVNKSDIKFSQQKSEKHDIF